MLYFLQIAYKGTHYHGWQRQSNCLGIQQVIEDALTKMTRQKCILIGCGRTDAGVHASQYFAHVRLEKEPVDNWQYKLNRMLPSDIAIQNIFPLPHFRHAQHDATERTYQYFIHLDADPFLADFSSFYEIEEQGVNALQQCISAIVKATDFRAFCKQPDKVDHTRCTIFNCTWETMEDGRKMKFEITANRFLRGMVRLLVGNLLEVLKGRLSPEQFIRSLETQEPLPYFTMAYPQGLYLSKVVYPYLQVE